MYTFGTLMRCTLVLSFVFHMLKERTRFAWYSFRVLYECVRITHFSSLLLKRVACFAFPIPYTCTVTLMDRRPETRTFSRMHSLLQLQYTCPHVNEYLFVWWLQTGIRGTYSRLRTVELQSYKHDYPNWVNTMSLSSRIHDPSDEYRNQCAAFNIRQQQHHLNCMHTHAIHMYIHTQSVVHDACLCFLLTNTSLHSLISSSLYSLHRSTLPQRRETTSRSPHFYFSHSTPAKNLLIQCHNLVHFNVREGRA